VGPGAASSAGEAGVAGDGPNDDLYAA